MKKLIAAIFAVLSIAVMGAISANASEEYSVGDVNGDGAVDSSDSSDILAYYSAVSTGKQSGWDDDRIAAGDVDGDGKTDSSDASYVLSYFSYIQTSPEDAEILPIRGFIAEMEANKEPVEENPPVEDVKIENYVLAPEGLDPGQKGTIQYIVNTAELTSHDEIPLYNIKENNEKGGVPYFVRNYYVTENDKRILNEFAEEHFTETMTNYDRLEYTWRWLHENITYADGQNGRPAYSEIWNDSFVEACFVKKAGQCIQYNGAFAMMMAYMGYDSYMLEQWNRPETLSVQHFATEAVINGTHYSTEVGEKSYDNPPYYYWMWLFNESKARFHGLSDE